MFQTMRQIIGTWVALKSQVPIESITEILKERDCYLLVSEKVTEIQTICKISNIS